MTKFEELTMSNNMAGASADGLLGLDFFENTELTIDFKRAEIRVIGM